MEVFFKIVLRFHWPILGKTLLRATTVLVGLNEGWLWFRRLLTQLISLLYISITVSWNGSSFFFQYDASKYAGIYHIYHILIGGGIGLPRIQHHVLKHSDGNRKLNILFINYFIHPWYSKFALQKMVVRLKSCLLYLKIGKLWIRGSPCVSKINCHEKKNRVKRVTVKEIPLETGGKGKENNSSGIRVFRVLHGYVVYIHYDIEYTSWAHGVHVYCYLPISQMMKLIHRRAKWLFTVTLVETRVNSVLSTSETGLAQDQRNDPLE